MWASLERAESLVSVLFIPAFTICNLPELWFRIQPETEEVNEQLACHFLQLTLEMLDL